MQIASIEIPKVGFMDLCACVTRSGRRDLVRKIVDPFTKLENITAMAAEGAAAALDAGTAKLTDLRCSQIATGCQALETCCSIIKESITPEGDGGKKITVSEKERMRSAVDWGVSNLLTQDAIDKVVGQLINKVP